MTSVALENAVLKANLTNVKTELIYCFVARALALSAVIAGQTALLVTLLR